MEQTSNWSLFDIHKGYMGGAMTDAFDYQDVSQPEGTFGNRKGM